MADTMKHDGGLDAQKKTEILKPDTMPDLAGVGPPQPAEPTIRFASQPSLTEKPSTIARDLAGAALFLNKLLNGIAWLLGAPVRLFGRGSSPSTAPATCKFLPQGSLVCAVREDSLGLIGLQAIRPDQLVTGPKRYKVLRLVGEGGFALVFEAEDLQFQNQELGLRRLVAIKIIKPEDETGPDPEAVQAAIKEAAVQAKLEHPNIVPIYEAGITPDQPGGWTYFDEELQAELEVPEGQLFVAMMFVQGKTLTEFVSQEEASLNKRLDVFHDMLKAMKFSHKNGVIHRDLKPDNVKIQDETDRVLVLDWGLARILGCLDAYAGQAAGTPGYMAPEQIQGQETDPRTDVYTLGVILYELIAKTMPFPFPKGGFQKQAECFDYLRNTLESEKVKLSEVCPGVSPDLEAIVEKAMAKNPEDRYQHAGEMLEAFERFREGVAAKERADKAVEEACRLLGLNKNLEKQFHKSQEKLASLKQEIPVWESLERKKPMLDLEDRIIALQRTIESNRAQVVVQLNEALRHNPDSTMAHQILAGMHKQDLERAEQVGDRGQMAIATQLLQLHDRAKTHVDWLKGNGRLTLDSDPSGARVEIFRYEERDRQMVPERFDPVKGSDPRSKPLGGAKGSDPFRTPLEIALPLGSYLVILSAKSAQSAKSASIYRDIRYPVHITRQHHWNASKVRFYTEEQIGKNFIYVPAGPFLFGGDPFCSEGDPGYEREIITLDDFFISQYPVTCAEFVRFLNDRLARGENPEEVSKNAPVLGGKPIWLIENNQFVVPDDQLLLPVTCVTWIDAQAYCEWLSAQSASSASVRFALPSLYQWEKAAGGTDGRPYPWGWGKVATFCNNADAFAPGQARLSPLSEIPPQDESVYGVRGCGGGVSQWAEIKDKDGSVVAVVSKGGSYQGSLRTCNTRYTIGRLERAFSSFLGFRVARVSPSE